MFALLLVQTSIPHVNGINIEQGRRIDVAILNIFKLLVFDLSVVYGSFWMLPFRRLNVGLFI